VSVVVVLGFEIMEKTDTTMEQKRREEKRGHKYSEMG
jgi:hypothetical protein